MVNMSNINGTAKTFIFSSCKLNHTIMLMLLLIIIRFRVMQTFARFYILSAEVVSVAP